MVRTFAYYKSGKVEEITNSKHTTIKMTYAYLGQYKIKDNTVKLTTPGIKFADENTGSYIECNVEYKGVNDSYGSITVCIPTQGISD